MKNVVVFIAGILFGTGGLYFYFSQSGSVELYSAESKVETKSESINDESLNVNISKSSEALLEEIKSLKRLLAQIEKKSIDSGASTGVSKIDESEMTEEEYTKALQKLQERRNKPTAEEERLGSIALDELKRNQPIELKELFSDETEDPNSSYAKSENSYKKHLSQEKDINWAYEAESFLNNYFASVQNSTFTAYRVDCRTRTCEVAGVFVFEEALQSNTTEDAKFTGRVKNFIEVQQAIQKHQLFARYFEVGLKNIHFNPNVFALNPAPYSFLLNRAKSGS